MIRESSDSVFEYALECHRREFSVIPLIPKTKRAAISWERYQTIPPQEQEVRKWFEKAQNVNGVAIVSGKIDEALTLIRNLLLNPTTAEDDFYI